MDIFQNQCSESLGFDSMLASNPINSPLQSTDSLNFSSSPYFTSIPVDQPATTTTTMTGANDVVLPSIFVKVPMQINQQYQQQNQNPDQQQLQPGARSSQEVIKCEDKSIKRELGDLRALEKGTAMVQLPSSAAQNYLGQEHQVEGDDGGNAELRVFCCELCPFATVEEQNLGEHRQARHPSGEGDVVEWVGCPACENKFRQSRSLETHLLEDHMMVRSEVQLLVDRRFPPNNVNSVPISQVVTSVSETQPMQSIPEQNKSRIYIKNVQLLKKPDVIEQENVQQESDQQQQQNRKIFIRNVSLLQNSNFMQNSEDFSTPSGLHESKYSFVVPAPSPNSESPPISESNSTPQRSKIFIRNVDILRNPLLPIPLPPVITSTCEMSRASSSESLYTTPPPPPVISPATSISSIGPPTTGGLNMLILPSSNSSTPPTTCTPPATISVAGPPDYSQSSQTAPRKSKIFIKNISVLKQPTIHLKSVDELNLMTIDQLQLQNLLPPVANGNSTTQCLDTLQNDDESSPMDDGEFGGLLDVETPSEPTDDFDGLDSGHYQELQDCESVTCDGSGSGEVVSNSMVQQQQQQQQQQNDMYHQQQQQFDNDFIIIEPGSSSTEDIHYDGPPVEQLRLPLQSADMLDHHLHHGGGNSSNSHHHQLQAPPPPLPLEPLPAVPNASQFSGGQTDEDILFVCAEEIINLDPTPSSMDHVNHHHQQQQQQLEPLDQQPHQGRIYVSDNLMEPVAPPQVVGVPIPPAPPPPSPTTPTQVGGSPGGSDQQQSDKDGRTRSRGRPKGAKQTGITKLKKLYTNLTPLEEGYKCDLVDCGARFRQPETLAYHKRCHYETPQQADVRIRCPECGSLEFRNWNTLHTHLWREHSIDMELYSCHLCNFKTPVLCRLNNTHMKIHSEEKNFVCAVCDKRFKNNKQLRNHRRSHRDQQQVPQQRQQPPAREPTPERTGTNPVKCVKCGLKFPNQKSLKSHVELKHFQEATSTTSTGAADGPRLRCSLCSMVFKTRYLLQSHVAKHSDEKRFSCENCDYSTNDHNAIRRHKMRHNSSGHMYRCSYCDYTSIQSTTYRKHLERMHADVASNLLYKCSRCTFVSISEVKYQLHRAKHEADDQQQPQETTEPTATPPPPPEQERHCESVNSDVVIVEGGGGGPADTDTAADLDQEQEQPPLDAFALIAAVSNQPMIRPAGFAHNLSKVDNFYGYPSSAGGMMESGGGQHYQQQQQQQHEGLGEVPQQQQQQQGPEANREGILLEGIEGYGEV